MKISYPPLIEIPMVSTCRLQLLGITFVRGFPRHNFFSVPWLYEAHLLLCIVAFMKYTSYVFMATFSFDFVASLSMLSCFVATQLCSISHGQVALFLWLVVNSLRDTLHSLQRISLLTSHRLPTNVSLLTMRRIRLQIPLQFSV